MFDREGDDKMSINYTILGLLESKEMSGYDLKKVMQELDFLPWSGNNNQIYKALVELLEEGFVNNRTEHRDGAPSKKIYQITQSGREKLRAWTRESKPQLPEFKKMLLVQLAFAEEEAIGLLEQYQEQLQEQLAYLSEKRNRQFGFPNRNEREIYIWQMLYQNLMDAYQCELAWSGKMKKELSKFNEDKSDK